MKKFFWLCGLGIGATLGACSESSTQFASAPVAKLPVQSDLQNSGSPEGVAYTQEPQATATSATSASPEAPEISVPPAASSMAELSLAVVLPAPELRLGSRTLQAKALLDGVEEANIRWSVTAPAGKAAGTINAQGLYQSPASGAESYKIQIHASWLDDESVQASAFLLLVPSDQVFVNCAQTSSNFPIIAEVYSLPTNTQRLPNFSQIAGSKATTVCMERYDVTTRAWTSGFPGVPNLFEWFALRTQANLKVAVSGNYRFRLNSDDGAKLFIDNQLVIDNDGQHPPRVLDGAVNLTAGNHTVVLEYFQGPRTQIALELFWIPANAPNGASYVYVPREVFQAAK